MSIISIIQKVSIGIIYEYLDITLDHKMIWLECNQKIKIIWDKLLYNFLISTRIVPWLQRALQSEKEWTNKLHFKQYPLKILIYFKC
jgi:hypothetical protein